MSRPPQDPEFEFLIHCTRRQLDSDTLPPLDMDRVLQLAMLHDVTNILYRGMLQLDAAQVLLARFEENSIGQAALYEFVFPQHLAQIITALEQAGIQTLLLKGYALGVQVYEQPALRPYIDFDILIRPEKVNSAIAVLRNLGYGPDKDSEVPAGHQHIEPYIHADWLPVELHTELVTSQGAMQLNMDDLWADAQPLELDGAATRTLCFEHLLIHLALHSVVTHLFEFGLKSLCDVHELVTTQRFDWDKVIATSQRWGCARQVYLTLRLVNELYGETVPGQILQQLSDQEIAPHLLEYSLQNLHETTVIGLTNSSGLAEVWQETDLIQRWRHILRRLFPRPDSIAATYHLDRRDWRLGLYYVRWQISFVHRHLRTGWHLLWADPETREQAVRELTRRDLLAWVTKR